MTTPLQIPPQGTQFLNPDGTVSLVWLGFLNNLVTRAGGATGGLQPADATLDALAAMNATPGLVVETSLDVFSKRSIAVTAGDLVVSNPAGVAGNPTLGLAAVAGVAGVHPSPTSITVDGKGRITAIT